MAIDFKCDVLCWQESVCVECIHFSPEKKMVELCISSWSSMGQPYIESATAFSYMSSRSGESLSIRWDWDQSVVNVPTSIS